MNEVQPSSEEKLVLRTEGLVKRYGKRTVANGVTINVKQGEIVGLLGPNGAGKTTSFYMTTGLVVPNEGHVYLGDQEITEVSCVQACTCRHRISASGGERVPQDECGRQYHVGAGDDRQAKEPIRWRSWRA